MEAATLSELSFKTGGTLLELLVDVGSEVQAGQVLARLEASALESALRQAQASLYSAATKLTELQDGLSTKDIRLSEASVVSADLKLAQARANTTDIRNAEGSLESAQIKLQELQASATEREIAIARLQLAAAEAKLLALQEPAERDIQAAQASVASAQAKYDQPAATPRGRCPQRRNGLGVRPSQV